MKKIFTCFIADKSGATAIECGLIVDLVSVAIIAGVTLKGENLDATFDASGVVLTPVV